MEASNTYNIEDLHLHLWQQRNFSSNDHLYLKHDIHRNNIAQILSVSNTHDSNASLSSALLQDEMKLYVNKSSSQFHPKSENDHSIDHSNSLLLSKANSPMNPINFARNLIASSSCDCLWLDEVKKNPSARLTITEKCLGSAPTISDHSYHFHKFDKCGQGFPKSAINNEQNLNYPASASLHGNSDMPTFVRDSKRRLPEIQDLSEEENNHSASCFKSAREQLAINQKKKFQRCSPQGANSKKSLGSRPRNQCYAKFVPPSNKDSGQESGDSMLQKHLPFSSKQSEDVHPKLKGIDSQLIELVMSEIMDHGPPIGWDDIAGLEFAKATIKEIVIWPMLRPDIFTGLRGPPKGILLFGPPGTGKTLIGKCIANQSGATFFSISASSLTSKWIGQAEKMVRALFAVASIHQPAVIFIDEIDSLLSQRSDSEHESSRRIKTEFFVQLDGATTSSDDRILVVGATNRPQEIDEAARRRLVKRLYIPLPDDGARKQIITKLMKMQPCVMSPCDIAEVVTQTDGYSGADVTNLCKDAALGPIRSLQVQDISKINKNDVRPINFDDFRKSLQRVRASVSQKDLLLYEEWNNIYGCGSE